MLAKLSGENQITLPGPLVTRLGPVEYFEVAAEGERIVLTPVRVNPADTVRDRLAALDITGSDVADAVAWARRERK